MKRKNQQLKPNKIKWQGNRIVGCQSTNHMVCKGELWICTRCYKVISWEEGSADDLAELCDDCWYDVRVLRQEFSIGNVSTWSLGYEAT